MFALKRAVKKAIKELSSIRTVNSSSLQSVKKPGPLPAVVVDFEKRAKGEQFEDGTVYTKHDQIGVTVHVQLDNRDIDDAEEHLELLCDEIEAHLIATFGSANIDIDEWYEREVPYGQARALAGSFAITIEEQV